MSCIMSSNKYYYLKAVKMEKHKSGIFSSVVIIETLNIISHNNFFFPSQSGWFNGVHAIFPYHSVRHPNHSVRILGERSALYLASMGSNNFAAANVTYVNETVNGETKLVPFINEALEQIPCDPNVSQLYIFVITCTYYHYHSQPKGAEPK